MSDKKVTFGLTENAAFILIYLFGWLSGLIFYLSEKEDKNIRLHALQWLIFSAAFTVIIIILSIISSAIIFGAGLGGALAAASIFGVISWILWIAYIIIMIIAIVRAVNGSILKLPVAYNIASKHA